MKKLIIAATAAAFALPLAAQAQETPPVEVAPLPAGEVTDAEIAAFADLILHGQGMQNDESMTDDQKRAAMVSAIQESELGLARFTSIAAALREDEALQERLQQAVLQRLAQG
ncbi:MAG: hypothetical protein WBA68_02635 [Alteraurantiacibacter sp.]